MRYQVIYTKSQPLIKWCSDLPEAAAFAKMMERQGYDIDIWEEGKAGSRPIPFPVTVRDYRKAKGLTQQQLADQSDVHVSQVKKLELGEIAPGNMAAKNLLAIADALGVDPRDLILTGGAGSAK